MEDSNGIAIDPWVLCRDRYLEDLSEDEKALYENATIENIFYGASAAQKRHEADSKTRLAARKLKPLVAALDQYGKALDVYSNASPTIMCPLWGSVRVVLQLAGDFEKYFDRLVDMFSRIGDVLPQFQAYTQLFPNHQRLLQVMSIAYLDIVKFCVEAKDMFREGKKLRGIRIAWKGVWKTFDSRFDDSLAEFRTHKENVEKEAMGSHMIEAGKARDLELREKALAETRRKGVDEGNRFNLSLLLRDTSTVVDNLLAEVDSKQIAVAYYYCDYSDTNTLMAMSIFGTLIKQLLAPVHIPQHLEQLITRCYAHGTRTPDNREMLEILVETLKLFSKVYLVIDGLDECRKEDRAVVLSAVKKLVTSDVPVVKTFVSSRDEIDTTACLGDYPLIYITEDNISSDIALFITEAVDNRLRLGEIVVHSQSLRQEIITGLLEGARGMFLWVSFQLDDLCEATSDHDIRETLRNLPRDLAETYSRILRKIKNTRGTPERLKKIQRVFKWIVCAERPLTIDELIEAIAIDTTDKFWDPEKMSADGERLIGHCGSLVVIDRENGAVRLAHYTVQQFLLSLPVDMSLAGLHIDLPTATVQIGEACITYLSFSDFETQVTRRRRPLPVSKTLLLDSAIDQVPFGKRLVKDVLTSWKHVQGAGANSVNPVIDLTNHLLISDGATSSEKMHAKYRFLKYAIDNWTWHTKGLTNDNQSLWKVFATLAMEKEMMFEFRPWGNIQQLGDFPHSAMFNWAISAQYLALLRLMTYAGSNLRTFLTSQAQSSVIAAAKRGSTEFLEVLCHVSGLSLRNAPTDEIVCDAAAEGRDKLLEVLLRLDADPNTKLYKFHGGQRALVCAFLRKQESTFRLLLEFGADSDLELHKDAFHDDELWGFELNTIPDQTTFSLLYLAVKSGHTGLTAALLEAGARVDIGTSSDGQGSETPLEAAVERGHYGIVNMLLEAKANVNYSSPLHPTVLQLAASGGNPHLVFLLLWAKADPNLHPDKTLPPALCEAAKKGSTERGEALLEAKWPTPLQAAARFNRIDMVKTFLEAKADINAISGREKMAPLQLAAEAGHSDVVEILLAAEADVDFRGPLGKTALQFAVGRGYLDILRQLLAAGAQVDAVNNKLTALQEAARGGDFGSVVILLEAGADVNICFEYTALELAVARDDSRMVKLLLASKANVNVASSTRKATALMEAARIGNLEIVEMLLRAGAEIEAANEQQQTALIVAYRHRHTNVIQRLLKAGADVNARSSSDQQTALMKAVIRYDLKSVELLLNAPAIPNLRDRFGNTALDIARMRGDPLIIDILKKAEEEYAIWPRLTRMAPENRQITTQSWNPQHQPF